MEKTSITDNLDRLLMAIHRQVVDIRDSDEKIPKIEMDKTLSNIRALYEQFTVLNYLNSQISEKTLKEPQPLPAMEPVVSKPQEPVVNKQPEPELIKPVEPESPFIPIVEKQPEAVVAPQEPPIPVQPVMPVAEPVLAKQPESVKPAVQTPAADERFQPKNVAVPVDIPPAKTTLTETQEAITLADKLRQQRLDDLYKAVSLSDKFLYMNELFEGENNAYKQAMDMLNRLTDTADAEQYLSALAQRYHWGDHAKAEKKFRELVSRKFI